jgi:deazaflavin-dependent oxidoreductase (nitroreductase family)
MPTDRTVAAVKLCAVKRAHNVGDQEDVPMSSPLQGFRRAKTGPLLALAFKVPPLLYHGPLASLLSARCVMVLTATGRKSGLPRTNGVSYMHLNGNYISFSGWGISSNWYRNVVANPEVTLKVGRKTIRATAHPVTDIAMAVEHAHELPIVEFVPHG